jgi:phage terminase large subunit GpA-like protein
MHEALDDHKTWMVVGCKSAQIAWTEGVVLNYVGRRIDIDPCAMVGMFAKEGDAKKFDREKFTPMAEVTPAVGDKIGVHKTRARGAGWDHKPFPGGFLNLVGSNSPGSVKSTSAPVVFIEEPDDANTNVKNQGDTITLLNERTKTFYRRKVIFGGTPTIEGFSRVEAAYQASDKREFHVPCPHCDELQTLKWTQVKWMERPELSHEVYGTVDVESARYACAHCGALWSDTEKRGAVRKGRWIAGAPFNGVAGFHINELYSPFPGSVMARLVEKYLTALKALQQGDDTKMRSFVNNTEGRAYQYKSNVPAADTLRERAERYDELTVPWGGVILTAGVDVQHDRLAVVIRAWGRGEESWLVWWGEIPGSTLTAFWLPDGTLSQDHSGAWWDLDQLLTGTFVHKSGARLRVRAASIDSSDGQTQDAVYGYVRRRMGRGFMAIKGESHDPKKDIFSPPKLSVDTKANQKPHPTGVKPFMVGTQVAKDLILGVEEKGGRIKLQGDGPGRMHWYATVRPDYWDQLTAEVKVPHRSIRGRLVWQLLSGRRNEALDCEVYALHAARSLKVNLFREERWVAEEQVIHQPGLGFEETAPLAVLPPAQRLEADQSDGAAVASSQAEAVQTPARPIATPAPAPAPAARPVGTRPVGGGSQLARLGIGTKPYRAKDY